MNNFGQLLKERMNILNKSKEVLAYDTFLEVSEVEKLLDETDIKNVDDYIVGILESYLCCLSGYFSDESIRKKDLIMLNPDIPNIKNINILLNDFSFILGIKKDGN